MQRCLHDPQRGYYSKHIRSIGSRGDFTTAPELSDLPAKAIAAWASKAMRYHQTRHLIEIGPGLGTLATQVIRHLPLVQRWTTKLHLVESSPTLLAHQKNTLGKRAMYHTCIDEAIRACGGIAIVYSNELVDAFPVRLFQKNPTQWMEIFIEHEKKQAREILIPLESLPESSIFSQDFPSYQRVEVHESYQQWLKSWLPLWKKGEMLTIDYGDTADRLYHRKPNGSLRAYFLQQRIEGAGIYQNQGLQDLTADVNFTDLIECTKPWLDHHQAENFADFLKPHSSLADSDLLDACRHFTCLRQSPHNRYM